MGLIFGLAGQNHHVCRVGLRLGTVGAGGGAEERKSETATRRHEDAQKIHSPLMSGKAIEEEEDVGGA